MIIVMGTIKAEAGEIDRLSSAMLTMMAATQAEEGCEHYVFSRALDDPDTAYVSERWRDQAALDAHFASSHMATFNAVIGGAKLKSVSVKAYENDQVRVLIGE
jgi:quinol monooxygenase YgiN